MKLLEQCDQTSSPINMESNEFVSLTLVIGQNVGKRLNQRYLHSQGHPTHRYFKFDRFISVLSK